MMIVCMWLVDLLLFIILPFFIFLLALSIFPFLFPSYSLSYFILFLFILRMRVFGKEVSALYIDCLSWKVSV